MRRSHILLFLTVLLLMAVITNAQTITTKKIQLVTDDGLSQTAWFYPSPNDEPSPLLILLHMRGHNHDSYRLFIESLHSYISSDSTGRLTIPHILNFDLRGHGQSTILNGLRVDYDSMTAAQYRLIPADINQLVEHLISDSSNLIDKDNIMVIGASIGANAAIMLTDFLPQIKKAVLLSPGDDYRGMSPIEAMRSFSNETLIFISMADTYSRLSSEKLAAVAGGQCELKIIDGKLHGTDIINNRSKARKYLLRFLFDD